MRGNMNFRTLLEIFVVIVLTMFVLFSFFVNPVKAECFPCFEEDTTQRTVQRSKKTKKERLGKKSMQGVDRVSSHGLASYYWQPQRVASGGRFNPNAFTAAHRTYPFGTRVRVTNVRNGRSVVVTINDRGPFVRGRIIDLSLAAARTIQMTNSGVVPVTVERF